MFYTLIQADQPIPLPAKLSEYGPFGALVGVLVALSAVCAFMWTKVVRPHLEASATIAASHATTTQALKDTAATMERIAIVQKEQGEVMGAQTERLERILDNIHKA